MLTKLNNKLEKYDRSTVLVAGAAVGYLARPMIEGYMAKSSEGQDGSDQPVWQQNMPLIVVGGLAAYFLLFDDDEEEEDEEVVE